MSCGCTNILEASESLTACDCPAAGFCQRHKCQKTEHFHTLCKTRPDYFTLWESGRGPCIAVDGQTHRRWIGLGTVVQAVIVVLTFGKLKPWPGCGCAKRKEWLDRIPVWGWWRR